MTKKRKREEEAMHECYRRLFKAATPSADFDELISQASVNNFGQKEIPFLDYVLERETHCQIVESILKEYKIPKILREVFRRSILLGCSPKWPTNTII